MGRFCLSSGRLGSMGGLGTGCYGMGLSLMSWWACAMAGLPGGRKLFGAKSAWLAGNFSSEVAICSDIQSASSHALPAPMPRPTQAGHALLLKRRTEKTTPKERPMVERMSMDEIARSHCAKYEDCQRTSPETQT